MAWPFDQLDPGFGPNYMPPQVSAQGGFDPSVGGMMPGFGAQAPGSDTPDFGPTTEQAVPQDYWARMAQASGAHPFSDIHFTQHTPGGGGLALLALLSAIGNAKAAHAANRVATVEQQNKQARENAKALAEHRWRSRENQAQRDMVQANLKATQAAAAALKTTPAKTPAELAADAGAVEAARLKALKDAGGAPPGSPKANAGQLGPDDFENAKRTDMANNVYIDLGGFSGKDQQAAARQYATKQGWLALSTPQATTLTKIDDAKQNIAYVKEAVSRFAPKDWMGRPLKAAQIKWSQITQSDPEASSYSALQLTAINNVVAIAGGAGSGVRINKEEIRRSLMNDMPRDNDSLPVVIKKSEHMNNLLEHLRNTVTVRDRSTLEGGVRAGASPPPAAKPPATGAKIRYTMDASGNLVPEGKR